MDVNESNSTNVGGFRSLRSDLAAFVVHKEDSSLRRRRDLSHPTLEACQVQVPGPFQNQRSVFCEVVVQQNT